MIDLSRELRASALPGAHVGDCMTRAADEIDRLRALVERGVALCARGRVIEAQMEKVVTKGGSGTPAMWAAEAYDVLLAEWERDALAALR